jgi:hypothetical protein
MAIYLQYGTYRHSPGECKVVIERELLKGEGGKPLGFRHRWNILGLLHGSSSAEITSKIRALEAAYSQHGRDLSLHFSDGALTAHQLLSRNTRLGTIVEVPPSFPTGEGAEYANCRTYSIAVTGDVSANLGAIISWSERLSWQGSGGADWGPLQCVDRVVWQQFNVATPVVVLQEGRAVGNGVYPAPAPPLWPNYLHGPTEAISCEGSSSSTERIVSWRYQFLASGQLTGRPVIRV